MAPRDLPAGALTLMFTDIEGSTRLLHALGERYVAALQEHRRIVRSARDRHGGVEVDTQGDAFFIVFAQADAALCAVSEIQRELAAHPWPEGAALRIRIGLHAGTPLRTPEGYAGVDLHLGARVMSAGHGGQVLLSEAVAKALAGPPPPGVVLRELGSHRLNDIELPVRLVDLVIEGLPADFPPLKTIGGRPTNLTGEPPQLIGRDDELAAIAALLAAERLVTLTGPGGSGKTSLALALAQELLPDQPDGVFAAFCAALGRPEEVGPAIAAALRLREQPGRSIEETLADYLVGRRMLLVLDNLEQVVGCAPLVETLLERAPGLSILATSRLALRLGRERVVAVAPLSPAPALELFATRAQAARPGLRLEGADRDAAAQICAALDGLPLAIELAAARARLMSPAQMLGRLERPLELAQGGPRHAPDRQRALRATIAWTDALLAPRLRRTLARLGVFASPFTIEAAEEVAGAELDELAELLDHYLLVAHEEEPFAGRLGMLETIRAFARERLDELGDHDQARGRHAAWCMAFGAAASPRFWDPAFQRMLDRFDAEREDVGQAIDWLIVTGRGDDALLLAARVAVFWDTRGQLQVARSSLERALAAAEEPDTATRALATFNLGRIALLLGDLRSARAALEAALEGFQVIGDPRGVVATLTHLAHERFGAGGGAGDDARALTEQALEVAEQSGEPWCEALALANGFHPDAEAEKRLDRALQIARTGDDRLLLASILINGAEDALRAGRRDGARARLIEGLSLAADVGAEIGMIEARLLLAHLDAADGDLDGALVLLREAEARAERAGDQRRRAAALYGLAGLEGILGRVNSAAQCAAAAAALVAAGSFELTPFERWAETLPLALPHAQRAT